MYATIAYLSLFEILVCGLGLILPKTIALTFLLPSGGIAVGGVLLAAVLMHFSVFDRLRTARVKALFGVLGGGVVVLALLGVPFPRYFAMLPDTVRAANLLALFVAGVNLLLAAVEKERQGVRNEGVLAWLRRGLPVHVDVPHSEPKR